MLSNNTLAGHFSNGPLPNRTCGFHRIRLSSVCVVGVSSAFPRGVLRVVS